MPNKIYNLLLVREPGLARDMTETYLRTFSRYVKDLQNGSYSQYFNILTASNTQEALAKYSKNINVTITHQADLPLQIKAINPYANIIVIGDVNADQKSIDAAKNKGVYILQGTPICEDIGKIVIEILRI